MSKAPWTPPGWVFGASWTTIMVFFAIYMSFAWKEVEHTKLIVGLFVLQLILNVAWNPIFFHFKDPAFAMVIITTLTVLMGGFLIYFWPEMRLKSALVLPYFVWLIIATSLNGYILFNN